MPLSPSTLADGLSGVNQSKAEPQAIKLWAQAYTDYFYDAVATVGSVPVSSGSLSVAQTAMAGAMVGMNAPGQGINSIVSGITAFFGAIASPPPASAVFASALAIVPPVTLGTLYSAILSAAKANQAAKASESRSMKAIAVAVDVVTKTATVQFPGAPIVISPIS